MEKLDDSVLDTLEQDLGLQRSLFKPDGRCIQYHFRRILNWLLHYCEKCLMEWIQKKQTEGQEVQCPTCRRKIVGVEKNLAANEMVNLINEIAKHVKPNKQSKLDDVQDRNEENERIRAELEAERIKYQKKEEEVQQFQDNQQKILERTQSELAKLRDKLEEQKQANENENDIRVQLEEQLNLTKQEGEKAKELQRLLAEQRLRAEKGDENLKMLVEQIQTRESTSQRVQMEAQIEVQRLAEAAAEHRQEAERLAREAARSNDELQNLKLRLSAASQEAGDAKLEIQRMREFVEKTREEKQQTESMAEQLQKDAEKLQKDADKWHRLLKENVLKQDTQKLQEQASSSMGLLGMLSSVRKAVSSYVGGEDWQGSLQADQFQYLETRGESLDSNIRRLSNNKNEQYIAKKMNLPYYVRVQGTGGLKELNLDEFEDDYEVPISDEVVLTPDFRANEVYYETFREAMLLSKLDHPNIVKLKGIIKGPDSLTNVMPYYGNDLHYFSYGTLRSLMTNEQLQNIMSKLISSLSYLHSADLVHRNLKPSSVIMFLSDEPELHQKQVFSVKLGGFSSARSLILTARTTQLLGNLQQPNFPKQLRPMDKMWRWAPELALLEAYDYVGLDFDWKKTDVWAFGCLIATVLRCGEPIFKCRKPQSHIEEILKVAECRPKSLTQFDAEDFPIQSRWATKGETTLYQVLSHVPLGSPAKLSCAQTNPELFKMWVNLLSKMLAWDPRERPSFQELLHHPVFADVEVQPIKSIPKNFGQALTDNLLIEFVKSLQITK